MTEILVWADLIYGIAGIILSIRFIQIVRPHLCIDEFKELLAFPLLFSFAEIVKFFENFGVPENIHEMLHILLMLYFVLLFYKYLRHEKQLEEALTRMTERLKKIKKEAEAKPI